MEVYTQHNIPTVLVAASYYGSFFPKEREFGSNKLTVNTIY